MHLAADVSSDVTVAAMNQRGGLTAYQQAAGDLREGSGVPLFVTGTTDVHDERCPACGRGVVDELTQVLDRRGWNMVASRTLELTLRQQRPVALLLADLDRFKRVNDTYGHPAGDEILRSLAAVLRQVVGDTGVVGRYGAYAGDEFLALLPGADARAAVAVAERIRRRVAAMSVVARSSSTATETISSQTVSIGVAVHHALGEVDVDLTDLLLDSDMALREAKRAGRDQVRLAKETA